MALAYRDEYDPFSDETLEEEYEQVRPDHDVPWSHREALTMREWEQRHKRPGVKGVISIGPVSEDFEDL